MESQHPVSLSPKTNEKKGSNMYSSNTIVIENPSFSWRLVDLWLIHHSSHLRQKGSYLQNDHPSRSLTSFSILFGLFIYFCVTFTFTTFVRISTIVCLFNAVNVSIERLRRNRNDGYRKWLYMSNYSTISKRTSEYINWSSEFVQWNSEFFSWISEVSFVIQNWSFVIQNTSFEIQEIYVET